MKIKEAKLLGHDITTALANLTGINSVRGWEDVKKAARDLIFMADDEIARLRKEEKIRAV